MQSANKVLKKTFVVVLLYITAFTAASQTYYKGVDNVLSRNIQKALIHSELNITENTFQLVTVEVKRGKLLSIITFSNDTTGNFPIIRQALTDATTGKWKRKRRRLVIIIPLFFIRRNSEAPFASDNWTHKNNHYSKQQHTILLPPLYLLSEGEKLRSNVHQ